MTRILRAKSGMKNERGFSILEAMIACVIMIIGIAGLMALFMVAAAKNAGQGDQATRCTEYAQDKMEQLMALSYTPTSMDTTSSVVGASTTPNGCSACGLTAGGSVSPAAPVANYVDYVNPNSATATNPDGISGSSTGALYMREWSISDSGAGATNVKTITVYVQAKFTADVSQSLAPTTTLVAYKGQY